MATAWAHAPEPRAEQRHVDNDRLNGALPVVQRAHDPAGDVHPPDRVAETRCRWRWHMVIVGPTHADGRARPEPERKRIVRASVGVRAALALPAAADVDDVGVVRPDVLDVYLELLADTRQLVGEEHVAGGSEPVDDLDPFRRGQVDAQAALAPVECSRRTWTSEGMLNTPVDARLSSTSTVRAWETLPAVIG